MAVETVLSIDQGKRFSQSFSTANFTGVTVRGQLRRSYFSTRAIDFDILVTTTQVTISLDADVTGSLVPYRYVYEVVVENSEGQLSQIIAEGIAVINPGTVR
jgi:hypothetical protein